MATIGTRELNSFISAIRTQRHNSATSVRRKVATLKGFFSYLHRERIIPNDPSLTLIYPEIYPALPEFLEHTQVDALLAAAAEHDAWLALLTLMLETGLKRDEVVALGRADVYLPADAAAESYLVVRETEQAKRLRSRRLELGRMRQPCCAPSWPRSRRASASSISRRAASTSSWRPAASGPGSPPAGRG